MRILFLNPQGNFDPTDAFWTEHADFGGQLVYVKELAIALAELGHEVDIVTRQFEDDTFSCFDKPLDGYQNVENLRIVRIPCGPNQFLEKEKLWPYIHEWVEGIIAFYEKHNQTIDFVTTHYGDGGLAGVILKAKTSVPFSFTGHSLGAQKMDKLNITKDNFESLIKRYQFDKRIIAERLAMKEASIVFTSTAQERDEQYKHQAYLGAGDLHNPEKFIIAPPGANETLFDQNKPNELETQVQETLNYMLIRDLNVDRLNLPSILLASRLDAKKNHVGLLKAYAASNALQSIANVVISLRGVENAFENYEALKENEKAIMDQLFEIIRHHKLQGKVSFINITSQKALAASYRYFAKTKSVFALPALYEPFGLAPIEAMCAGLPVAVTKYGGPLDVLSDEKANYGVLLDVSDQTHMIKGLIQAFKHHDYYQKQGLHRVKTAYTWKNTAKTYLDAIDNLAPLQEKTVDRIPPYFIDQSEEDVLNKMLKQLYIGG